MQVYISNFIYYSFTILNTFEFLKRILYMVMTIIILEKLYDLEKNSELAMHLKYLK